MANSNISLTVFRLLMMTVAMFGFGFLLVPLYDVLCDITGLNGKTSSESYRAVEAVVDESRVVKVQFMTINNENMNWEFSAAKNILEVNPGRMTETVFYAKNPRTTKMIAQAVPSISPSRAAQYFHKTECFCFTQQILAGGETVMMPLRFIVDQDLPRDISTITLSYTLFDVTHGFNSHSVDTNP